jgi:photosystem II stability/assembly factor-like uncharacterized protein
LAHDHGLAAEPFPVASSYVPVTLAWGPLIAVVGVGVLAAAFSATAAWSAFCLTRREPRKVGRFLRIILCAATVAQPAVFVTGVLEINLAIANRMVALVDWAELMALLLGVATLISSVLALRSVRLGLLRISRSFMFGTVIIAVAATFFATSSVLYTPIHKEGNSLEAQFGFWHLGTAVQTGLFDSIGGLSCPTQGPCVVLARDLGPPLSYAWSVGTFSGGRIRPLTSQSSVEPRDITCATESICLVTTATGQLVRTTDGGRTFRTLGAKTPIYTSLRCDSADRCYAIASSFFAISTDGGAQWKTLLKTNTNPEAPSRSVILSGSCPTLSDCFVLGYGVGRPYAAFTTNGGRSWSPSVTGRSPSEWADARCVSSTTCYGLAIGLLSDTMSTIVTTNGGQTWSLRATIPGVSQPQGLSCPAIRTCIAVGVQITGASNVYSAEVSDDGGMTWHTTYSSDAQLGPIGCDLEGRCAIGVTYDEPGKGAAVEVSSDWGRTWKTVSFPRAPVSH